MANAEIPAPPPMTPDAAEMHLLSQFVASGFLKLPLGGQLEPAPVKLAWMRGLARQWWQFVDMTMDATNVNGRLVQVPHRVFMLTDAGRRRLSELRVGAKG